MGDIIKRLELEANVSSEVCDFLRERFPGLSVASARAALESAINELEGSTTIGD